MDNVLIGVLSVAGEVVYTGGGEPYSGSYSVTPQITSQVLPTINKKMENNLTVLAIPYYETTNPTGKTIIIGGN